MRSLQHLSAVSLYVFYMSTDVSGDILLYR